MLDAVSISFDVILSGAIFENDDVLCGWLVIQYMT